MPTKDVERIRALKNAIVLDDSSSRMLLVEAPPLELKALMDTLSNWVMTPEQMIQVPDPRPKLRSGK